MESEVARAPAPGELSFARPTEETLLVRFSGSWTLRERLPSVEEVRRQLETDPHVRRVAFDTRGITDWDSGLLTFLVRIIDDTASRRIETDREGLPGGVRRLLDLAYAVPEKKDTGRGSARAALLPRIGSWAMDLRGSAAEMLTFLGEAFLAVLKLPVGKARFRRSDLLLTIQECGVQALPIVTLISFLVGLILAFIGAVQLRQFGAQIFVADLVGLGMAREMGAMMTAIIMAGRTGAAFAAQLGTMTVNEEIDALKTMGISPMEFLVLPRMLALVLMMPLLCLYADLLGILGGAVVGVGMLDLEVLQYYDETRGALGPGDFGVGLIKAAVYGVLVAISGCLRGMQCGRSASAVGAAATSAVVTALVLIVVASGMLNLIDSVLAG